MIKYFSILMRKIKYALWLVMGFIFAAFFIYTYSKIKNKTRDD